MPPIISLNIPQTVFCLFYAIFWGLVANAQIRWKAFDWPLAIAGRSNNAYAPSWKRLKRSLVYLMILPILLFLLLTFLLTFLPPRAFGVRFIVQLAVAVVAAHAAFAPYRLWLSGVERFPEQFYYRKPSMNAQDDNNATERYVSQPGAQDDFPLDPQWAHSNLWVGICYVVGSLLGACAGYVFG